MLLLAVGDVAAELAIEDLAEFTVGIESAVGVSYDLNAVRRALKVAADLAEQDGPLSVEGLRPLVDEVRAIPSSGAAP